MAEREMITRSISPQGWLFRPLKPSLGFWLFPWLGLVAEELFFLDGLGDFLRQAFFPARLAFADFPEDFT